MHKVASESDREALPETTSPFKVVVLQSPINSCLRMGWFTAPSIGRPLRKRAMRVANRGTPDIKDFVPSTGSKTHTYSLSWFSTPYSSPIIP